MRRFFVFIITTVLLCSCRESLPLYFDQIEGVYFNNIGTGRVPIDSASYTFVYENDDVSVIEVPVYIQLLGRPADRDRKISLSVTSTDAEEGVDWSLEGSAVLHAGETSAEVLISLHRSEELKYTEKSLTLGLEPNEEFILPFETRKNAAGLELSSTRFTISFSEMFTAAPQGWKTIFAGSFNQKKFELICKVTGTDRKLFNTPGAISDAKWMFIRSKVIEYLLNQDILRQDGQSYDRDAYDENGWLIDLNK